MREKIKCLDGPMEGEEVLLDRRLFKLYDRRPLKDDEDKIHIYEITNNGLRYVSNA